ncbi:MAG: hypothetical protein U1C46_00250, partial [Bacteroidales bacterium]|nr:hypothetical protein [Bacteroidales bacterium]
MKPSLFREALIFIKIITKRVLVLLIRYRIGRILFVNITLRKFKIIRFISIENAHKNYPDRIEILHKYSKKLSYSEPNYHGHKLNSDKIGNIDGFDNYVLLVKDAKITGCSNLIELDDGSGIYEIKFRDLENIINYSDEKFVFHSKNQ